MENKKALSERKGQALKYKKRKTRKWLFRKREIVMPRTENKKQYIKSGTQLKGMTGPQNCG